MNTKIQTSTAYLLLTMIAFQILPRISHASSDEIIYPLKKISALECRFEDFDTLSGNLSKIFRFSKQKTTTNMQVKMGDITNILVSIPYFGDQAINMVGMFEVEDIKELISQRQKGLQSIPLLTEKSLKQGKM